jgi:hypothetical protein
MKRIVGPLGLLFALAACGQPNNGYGSRGYVPTYSPSSASQSKLEPGEPITLTPAMQQMVKRGVTESLKDPESARFGKMVAVKDSKGVITVCGMVNAKNSLGGYVGMSPYLGVLSPEAEAFVVAGIGSSDTGRPAAMQVCSQAGIGL